MFKLLLLVMICGAAYAAFAVPYEGHTIADRVATLAKDYLEHDSDEHPAHPSRPAPNDARQAVRQDPPHAPVVAQRAPNASRPQPRSSEQITREDREALDRLIPR
jgi:hypothetical protein